MSFGFGIGDLITTFELANRVRQKWADAPIEYASIRNEVRNVDSVLRVLNDLSIQVGIGYQQQDDIQNISVHCAEALHRADGIVNTFPLIQDTSNSFSIRAKRNWERFRLNPDDVRNVRDALAAAVTQLTAVQNNIEISLIKDVAEGIDNLQKDHKQYLKRQIADWFAPATYADQQADQLARRQAGTAQWFLQDQQYVDWQQGTNSTLFCPGIPGAGKTIMVAAAIDDLRKVFSKQNGVVITYFYCNFRRQSEQNINHILAALVRQIFEERDEIPVIVKELYEHHRERHTKPQIDDLRTVLRNLIQAYTKVFILIDALDECENSSGTRDRLLSELLNLQAQTSTSTNLLATSRLIPDITNYFDGVQKLEIVARKEDVEVYLDGHMSEMRPFVRKSASLQEDIKTSITSAVDGMFLLARLHFESLQDKMTIKALKSALEVLPKGSGALDIAYEEAMTRIKQQRNGFSQLAIKSLSWIVLARRELSIKELQEAVIIEPGIIDINHGEDLVDVDDIVSVCAGLVTIDPESQTVRLVHYTTQEFFMRTEARWLPDAATLVGNNCIDFLCMDALDCLSELSAEEEEEEDAKEEEKEERVYNRYKLLGYIGQNWGFHASELPNTANRVQRILYDKVKLPFITRLIRSDSFVDCSAESISGLHVSAYFDDIDATQFLLASGTAINQQTSDGWTALSVAAYEGHEQTVQLLLTRSDLDVNLGEPLSEAAFAGHIDIIKLLLTHYDIDVNLGEPLYWAASRGFKDAVETLLAHPEVDVNLDDLLYWAARSGYEATAKLLLAHPNLKADLKSLTRDDRIKQFPAVIRLLEAHHTVTEGHTS